MTVWKNTATLAKTTVTLVSDVLGGKTPANATASYNNQVKDVPSVQEKVTVLDKDNLQQYIDAGNFSQADIDAAK